MTALRGSALGAALVLLASGLGRSAEAQERGAPPLGFQLTPVFQSWSFADGIAHDSATIKTVSQIAVPIAFALNLGSSFTVDLVGAYARGTVDMEDGESLMLDGPTDMRLRMAWRAAGDQLMLTAGVNVPTGKSRLAGSELEAQRVIGSPALRLPAPALGTGFGATVGVVVARRAGPWALALGTSYEQRGEYQPVETAIAGITTATDLDPGDAIHLSLGADRLIGPHRVAFLLSGDIYGEDQIGVGDGVARRTSNYKLGPTLRALAQVDLGLRGFREFSLYGQLRHRTAFTGIDGNEVEGSSGTVIDLGAGGILGRPRSTGVIIRADLMVDSGLEVDNTVTTAGATVFGITAGVSIPAGRGAFEPFVRFATGQIDSGPATTSATSLSAGLSFGSR